MAKKKAKGKNWNKQANRWVNDNRTVLALLGGIAGGAALTAALTSRQGQQMMTDLSDTVKDWMPAAGPDTTQDASDDKKNTPSPAGGV
ncbi:MAG: hypothetical protein ICV83_17520 [Cytophagales bacterium]|nr:hypothetical protein [Cytophagales bacterium]